MSETPTPLPSPRGHAGAIAAGLLLIALITPLSQFLTVMTVHADVETASPVGWAVGLVFSLVLVNAVFLVLARRRLLAPSRLVVIYCMLTIAAPLMNLGLVRQFYLASFMVIREYAFEGNSTYRSAYNALNPRWFPVVPTVEGLAWARAGRLLDLLRDPSAQQDQQEARRRLEQQITEGNVVDLTLLALLGPDEVAQLQDSLGETPVSPALRAALAEKAAATEAISAAAAAELPSLLAPYDEYIVSRHPAALAGLDVSGRRRLERELQGLSPEARALHDERLAALTRDFDHLRRLTAAMGAGDRANVHATLAAAERERLEALTPDERAEVRHGTVYRMNRSERNRLLREDGTSGPNQNLAAFREGLWADLNAQQVRDRAPFLANVSEVIDRVPWHLWLSPLLHWGTLFTALFLFLMCLAEWLRRKWVDREHLAFPLVEVIDQLIRHDSRLETAENPTAPEPRRRLFYPLFVIGALIGFALLSLEAAGHYGLARTTFALEFNLSKELFSTGPLQELTSLHFVLSPIVLGLLFLVSLEVSFSIWVTYLAFTLVAWLVRISLPAVPTDPVYTGWAGGRFFPFTMEQLLGASLAFAVIVLLRTWGNRERAPNLTPHGSLPYVSSRWQRAGMIGLPLLITVLLWDFGLTNLPFIAFIAVCALAVTLTSARIRAETGLPTHHATYEFAKLPLIFGLTGFTGATVYTRFITLAFLPVTLLFRTLPQQLENLELARRHRLSYRTVATATFLAFVLAIVWGGFSALLFSYVLGDRFTGAVAYPGQGEANNMQIAHYPLWISHFLGENGLDKFDSVHGIRLLFVALGAAVVVTLTLLRRRFLSFPLHPLGYLLMLFSIFYLWVSPYLRGAAVSEAENIEASFLWGSALVAWMVKGLIVNYGGMNAYKRAKPMFTGLVLGAVVAIFAWNLFDLACSLIANSTGEAPGWTKPFQDRPPYSPRFY